MATETSERMMNLLKELAVTREQVATTTEEKVSYRRRQREIRAEMKRIARESRGDQSKDS